MAGAPDEDIRRRRTKNNPGLAGQRNNTEKVVARSKKFTKAEQEDKVLRKLKKIERVRLPRYQGIKSSFSGTTTLGVLSHIHTTYAIFLMLYKKLY